MSAGCRDRAIQLIQDKKATAGWTNEQIGKKVNMSTSAVSSFLKGERNPSLDTLFALSEGLEIPFEDLAFCFVFSNSYDDTKVPRKIGFLKLNNYRKPIDVNGEKISGTLTGVTEGKLQEFYHADVSGDFLGYVKKYLVDAIYKGDYQDYLERKRLNEDRLQSIKLQTSTNSDFKEIIEMLQGVDSETLHYIKENIALYLKYKR